MKAKIFKGENDHQGQILDGDVVQFYMGIEGWNITLSGGENYKRVGLVDVIQTHSGEVLMDNFCTNPGSRLIIQEDGSEWLGFCYDQARVQIYEDK